MQLPNHQDTWHGATALVSSPLGSPCRFYASRGRRSVQLFRYQSHAQSKRVYSLVHVGLHPWRHVRNACAGLLLQESLPLGNLLLLALSSGGQSRKSGAQTSEIVAIILISTCSDGPAVSFAGSPVQDAICSAPTRLALAGTLTLYSKSMRVSALHRSSARICMDRRCDSREQGLWGLECLTKSVPGHCGLVCLAALAAVRS